MNYITIIAVILFCVFMLMYVGSSKDNRFELEIQKLAPNNNVRFMVAAPNGELLLSNSTVKKFSDDINRRDGELMADYIYRDNNVIKAYKAADTYVTNGAAAADKAYYALAQTDAQNRANAAKTAANNNTAKYYVKKNTNYTVTADGAILGRGKQDNWGERYVTWTGSKGVKKSKFLIK